MFEAPGHAIRRHESVGSFSYTAQGDLAAVTPPKGAAAKVRFEYGRYNQDGTYEGTYEGQVTRILYADSTSEYFGYSAAGEPSWWRRASPPGGGGRTGAW